MVRDDHHLWLTRGKNEGLEHAGERSLLSLTPEHRGHRKCAHSELALWVRVSHHQDT